MDDSNLLPEDGVLDPIAIKAALGGWRPVRLTPFEERAVKLLQTPDNCHAPVPGDVALL